MTETTPTAQKTDAQEPSGPAAFALFALCLVNFVFGAYVGLDWLRPVLPLLPDNGGSAPFAMILGGAVSLVVNARPAGAADWGRIVLFFLALDVGGLLLLMAGVALTRHTGLDPWDGYGVIVGFPVGVAFLYVLSDFLMRRGLVPGCPSWRELRRRRKEAQQPYSGHYRPRHWVAGLVAGLVVAGLAWPSLAWLGDVAMLYMLNPRTAQPLALGMGLFAGLAMLLSRPPDGGIWGRSLLATLLAALLFPVFLVALDKSSVVWAPSADPDEVRSLAGVLISILGAMLPALMMVGVAAVKLGGLPTDPEVKPDDEAVPTGANPPLWKPLSFDHAAAAAILFIFVWAGLFGLLESLRGAIPAFEYPPMAALVMGLAAGVLPLAARPSGARGWAAVSAALLLTLAAMPAALAALVFAIRALFDPLPDIHTILAITHFGPLLPAAAIVSATAWVVGRHLPADGGSE